MSVCNVCNIKTNRSDINISCNLCSGLFHGVCVSLNKTEIEFLKKQRKPWICTPCNNQRRQDRLSINDETVCVLPKHGSTADIHNITNANIDDVVFPLVAESEQVPSLKEILIQLKQNSLSMEKRFDSLDKAMVRIDELIKENAVLKNRISSLEVKLDRVEQLSLNNSVEIVGLPLIQDEKLIKNAVMSLVKVGLKYSCDNDAIVDCFRVKNNISNKPGKVIVRFKNSDTKSDILSASRKTKLSSKIIDNSDNVIYINQRITKFKRDLFVKAKEIKLKLKYKYLWMRDATIMMRKLDGGRINYINSLADLGKLVH